jgi:hypothetical protein
MKIKYAAIVALLAVAFISLAAIGLSGDTAEAKGKQKDASVDFTVSLFGDPDFDAFSANELAVRILTAANIGSSGLDGVKAPNPDFNVDSFFDITYRVDGGGSDGTGVTTTTITVEADVEVVNPDVDPSAVIDRVRDAFAKDKKKEYVGHVTLLR